MYRNDSPCGPKGEYQNVNADVGYPGVLRTSTIGWSDSTVGQNGSRTRLRLCRCRASIGTEDLVPEEMDDTEIAVRVKVVNEVEFLLASEPREPLQPRCFHVVFLIKQNMDVKGRCTRSRVNHEEIEGHYDVGTPSDQKHWNEEVGRVVAFVTEVRRRDEMILGIVGVMEVDVIAEQLTADGMVAKLVVHQRLSK